VYERMCTGAVRRPPWLRQRDCNNVRQHAGRQSSEQSR